MSFEIEAHFGGTFGDVVAVDGAGEAFVLHLFEDAFGFDFEDAAARFDVGGSGDEAGEFITGEEGFLHERISGDAGEIGMGEDGAADCGTEAAGFENGFAFCGMVWEVGVDLPIEIVEDAGDGPEFGVLIVVFGVSLHAGANGKHVPSEAVALDEFTDERVGFFFVHRDISLSSQS